jgi:putative membrane protein
VTDSAAVAATATSAMTPAAPAAPAMTDANILAILDGANVADSSAGSVAATKGTATDVKVFGRDMMRDHHALRVAGLDLAKKLNITPALPANDSSAAAATAWHDSLTARPRGADWDKAYINHEVTVHEAVLNTAQTALGATQNADLKALIQKAAPNVQAHLDHAKLIQSKMK